MGPGKKNDWKQTEKIKWNSVCHTSNSPVYTNESIVQKSHDDHRKITYFYNRFLHTFHTKLKNNDKQQKICNEIIIYKICRKQWTEISSSEMNFHWTLRKKKINWNRIYQRRLLQTIPDGNDAKYYANV